MVVTYDRNFATRTACAQEWFWLKPWKIYRKWLSKFLAFLACFKTHIKSLWISLSTVIRVLAGCYAGHRTFGI